MILENEYGTAEIQNALFDIIKEFHDFCVKNDIQYGLYGGSCLGAIRHNGFIPWDDDLDIVVDRLNYKKLVDKFDLCESLNIHRTIWVQRIQKKNKTIINGYIPTLDVFVVDNVPKSPMVFKIKIFILLMLQGMLKENIRYEKSSWIYRICLFVTHILGKLFPKGLLYQWYERVSAIGNNSDSQYVHCTNTSFRCLPKKYKADTWKKMVLHDFEDVQLYVPEKYDQYLTVTYGDYMVFPKMENRIPEHAKKEK